MGAYKGVVRQPGSGRIVNWELAPGLALLGKQLDKLGITWYSIGNADHLRKQGGHTPWKPHAPFGVVTAIDVMKSGYPAVQAAILKLMKNRTYDTTWIDFINVNYNQYDWNGKRQGPSGDGHLHLEVLPSRTSFSSNLFYDMFGWPAGAVNVTPTNKPVTPPTITPPPTVTFDWEDDMYRTVKLRSRDEVWLVRGDGRLQHLSKAQFDAVKAANLKMLPSGADAKTKAKFTEAFVVENEESLAAFGTTIVKQASEVEGLD